MQSGQLTRIRRQRRAEYRLAVELAAQKRPAEAFAQLERMGAVAEFSGNQLHDAAAQTYLKALKQNQSALLVAPTWAEIEAVTEKVRSALKSSGVLTDKENDFRVFDSLSWTEAQKRDARQYRPGMALRFHQVKGGLAAGGSSFDHVVRTWFVNDKINDWYLLFEVRHLAARLPEPVMAGGAGFQSRQALTSQRTGSETRKCPSYWRR